MKKYLLCLPILAAALIIGCGRRGGTDNARTPQQKEAHTHAHEGHDHDSHAGHSHDHSGHSEHSHTEGECCGHGHDTEHSHEGHNYHSHDAGHSYGHSGHSHAEGESCGHDHSHDAGHSHDTHAGHNHDHEQGHEGENPDEIVFPAAQAARTDFKVERPTVGRFREVIKSGGTVAAAQNAVTVVTAPVSGVVAHVDGGIIPSAPVAKGQELFRISSGSLASGDAALKARITYEQAKAEFERAERLYGERMIAQSDFLAAQAAYLTARSEYEPLMNAGADGSVTVASPAAGYLAQVTVSPGYFVEMGQPLATVARSGRMQLRVMVSQSYFDRLTDIADANFRLSGSDKYLNVKELNGSLLSAGRIVSQGSALIPVVFEFDGGAVPDGAYVEVNLLGRARDGVTTLPLTAVTEQQGLYYVYVQLDEEHYSRREVTLGADDGVRVEILSGVCGHDMVVTRGAVNVRMAAASGSIPHGHTH